MLERPQHPGDDPEHLAVDLAENVYPSDLETVLAIGIPLVQGYLLCPPCTSRGLRRMDLLETRSNGTREDEPTQEITLIPPGGKVEL